MLNRKKQQRYLHTVQKVFVFSNSIYSYKYTVCLCVLPKYCVPLCMQFYHDNTMAPKSSRKNLYFCNLVLHEYIFINWYDLLFSDKPIVNLTTNPPTPVSEVDHQNITLICQVGI